jgi:hypothetical protein
MKKSLIFFYDVTYIQDVLYLYEGGMPIANISVVLGISEDEVNDILDNILCYLE